MKTNKEDFPALEDIEWIRVDAPEWWRDPVDWCGLDIEYNTHEISERHYIQLKMLHENSKDLKVTWKLKQKDPHAELRKEFEENRERGKFVQVMVEITNGMWTPVIEKPIWRPHLDYKLVYYKFNPIKALVWSYREGGVFIECLGWDRSSELEDTFYLMSVNSKTKYKFNSAWRNMRLNIDKEGDVKLSNGTTINVYKDGLINDWFDAEKRSEK
jgi:hypothetical protein